jgi:hypothetical protein
MWPPQRGVCSLEPDLEKQIVVSFVLIITLRYDSFSPISLSSLAFNIFELATKIICID